MTPIGSTPPPSTRGTVAVHIPSIAVTVLREAVRAVDYALALSDTRVPAQIQIQWKTGFTTAAWRYRPPHVITIGDQLLVNAAPTTRTNPLYVRGYVQSYYEHELAHACYTERDPDRLVRELALMLGFPPTDAVEIVIVGGTKCRKLAPWVAGAFALLNLFEDARIEHRWRRETRRRFGWTMYEQRPVTVATTAIECFSRRIQTEGEAPMTPGVDQMVADRYYLACCAAPDTRAVIELVAMWWHEVGPYQQPNQHPNQQLMNVSDRMTWRHDLTVALALHLGCAVSQGNGEEIDAAQWESTGSIMVNPCIDGGEDGRPSGQAIPVDAHGTAAPSPPREVSPVQFAAIPAIMSTANIDRLTDRLRRLCGRHDYTVMTWSPSRRVSARATLTGRAPFQHAVSGTDRCLWIALYVDCSGSMDGHHMQEGRLLIAALSRLARTRLVTGDVILTAYHHKRSCHTILPLPIADDLIGRIIAYANREGLEAALHATAERVRKRDLILVYSDGEIGDAPIDRTALRAKGVTPIGCYVGDPRQAARLARWFTTVLVAPTAEELVDMIVRERRTT